jgi:CDP-diacylglycerol--glycerol-3-phosphate 3-phosphatidyltransferase
MNGPNFLTILRIFSIPVLVVVLLTSFRGQELTAFLIFIFATLTDTVDGIWARKTQQTTVLGQLLDPVADKLLVSSVLICMVQTGHVPAWMAVIIIGREFAVTGFRAIASSRGHNIPASWSGKIKMGTETFTISLLILGKRILGSFFILSQVGLWLVVGVAIFSGVEYYVKYWQQVFSDGSV